MGFLLILLSIVFLVIIIDWIPLFNTWQSRIKIGNFKNESDWENKVKTTAQKWLSNTPTIKLTDNNRLIVIDILKGNYKRSSIQSWQKASLLVGLNQYVLKTNDTKTAKIIADFVASEIDDNGNWKRTPTEIDAVILGYAILKLDTNTIQKCKPAFDFLYQFILNLKGNDGIIAYRKHNPDFRYVDTIGFISPFLVRYGLLFHDEHALQIGINQIKAFNQYGLLKDTFIPCHTYNVASKLPVGLFGWGRGLGWYAIGLIDSWNELPENHPYKAELTQNVISFAKMAIANQKENGAWSWLILNKDSQNDSSTVATLAWFLANAAILPEISTACNVAQVKALHYLMKVTRRSGAIDFSQGDTKGIGVHSQHFDILPFTQGFCLRTISI